MVPAFFHPQRSRNVRAAAGRGKPCSLGRGRIDGAIQASKVAPEEHASMKRGAHGVVDDLESGNTSGWLVERGANRDVEVSLPQRWQAGDTRQSLHTLRKCSSVSDAAP